MNIPIKVTLWRGAFVFLLESCVDSSDELFGLNELLVEVRIFCTVDFQVLKNGKYYFVIF